MIRAENLKKSFGPIEAVKNVSIEALNGQITALLGENGAGKTTTIRMIAGAISCEGGKTTITAGNVAAGKV